MHEKPNKTGFSEANAGGTEKILPIKATLPGKNCPLENCHPNRLLFASAIS